MDLPCRVVATLPVQCEDLIGEDSRVMAIAYHQCDDASDGMHALYVKLVHRLHVWSFVHGVSKRYPREDSGARVAVNNSMLQSEENTVRGSSQSRIVYRMDDLKEGQFGFYPNLGAVLFVTAKGLLQNDHTDRTSPNDFCKNDKTLATLVQPK